MSHIFLKFLLMICSRPLFLLSALINSLIHLYTNVCMYVCMSKFNIGSKLRLMHNHATLSFYLCSADIHTYFQLSCLLPLLCLFLLPCIIIMLLFVSFVSAVSVAH